MFSRKITNHVVNIFFLPLLQSPSFAAYILLPYFLACCIVIELLSIYRKMDLETGRIPVKIDNETIIFIEIEHVGREDVGFDFFEFSSISESIERLAAAIYKPIQSVSPDKATIKFGIEIAIEQGSLVSSIVRGNGKSNIEITMEWCK